MSYAKARDILSHVRESHRRFSDTLAQIEQESNSEGIEWISKSFRHHERQWQMALAKSGGDDEEAILETWIQFIPSEKLFQELDEIVVTPQMSIDQVAGAAVQFHEALMHLYATLSSQVAAQRAREFFTRLWEHEKTVVSQQAWASREI